MSSNGWKKITGAVPQWGHKRAAPVVIVSPLSRERKVKHLFDIDQNLSENMKKQISLIEEIIEVNDKSLDLVYTKIETSVYPISFFIPIIEHAIKIRPLNTTCHLSLIALLAKSHGYNKAEKIDDTLYSMLVQQGIICKEKSIPDVTKRNERLSYSIKPEYRKTLTMKELTTFFPSDEKLNIFINDDLDAFIEMSSKTNANSSIKIRPKANSSSFFNMSSKVGFNPLYHIPIDKNSPIRYVRNSDQSLSYLQVMAFFGAIKCFKNAILNISYQFTDVEYFATAGGNLEIIHILEQKSIKFGNCMEVAMRYHRNDIGNWITLHYNFDDNCLKDSCIYYNYTTLLYALSNHIDINDALTNAIKQDNPELVKNLIVKDYFKAQSQDKNGRIPLFVATEQNNLEIIKYLIESCHVSVDTTDNNGRTPLFIAASKGNLQIVKYLVEKCNADVEKTDKNRKTPIFAAAGQENIDVVKYLVETCHVNTEFKDYDGRTPIFTASGKGNLNIIKYLIDDCQTDITKLNKNALMVATENQNIELIKYLVNTCRANVECKDNLGRTPVHIATVKDNLELIKYFVETCHAGANIKDFSGKTPLFVATENNNLRLVKYFFESCNANVENMDNGRNTPLTIASGNGNFEILKYLVEVCKADIRHISINALPNAIRVGDLELIKFLIEKCKVDIRYKYDQSKPALFVAIERNDLDIIKYLIEDCHADVHIQITRRDQFNHEAEIDLLKAARKRGNPEVIEYITNVFKEK